MRDEQEKFTGAGCIGVILAWIAFPLLAMGFGGNLGYLLGGGVFLVLAVLCLSRHTQLQRARREDI
ncbi:hypothetical protein ACFZBU_47765 [Embleya sp. NPDC008237]|uniref:hypothetical protein n=1 Tax=Embleya sp. NPDC008237 TaxID=3363978 RepID=UPI0036E2C108